MADMFLYKELDILFEHDVVKKPVPAYLKEGLNPRFELRLYQEKAFARFFRCFENGFPGKEKPLHLLFNMATGSGKTLIMAGLILYLYEKGYRNFLFFVHSTNIIRKTLDNFLNPLSSKYLFNERGLRIDGRRPQIVEVANFEGVHQDDINIRFTTIQQLHLDLKDLKEGSVSYEDFQKSKTVLIADEAHHMSAATKSQAAMQAFESWENTVERIFRQNEDNLLLEFTATQDYEIPAMVEKYRRKVVYRYDLAEFRNDLYSKDVVIVRSGMNPDERILQALILSQYKQEAAAKHSIQLKPVILLKAQNTIKQSEENKANFHQLIDSLDAAKIDAIRRTNIPVVQRAFRFFNRNGISSAQLAARLKREFQESRCLSVNSKGEHENSQMLVNSLEDKDNRIRAVFAVQKLNEGWDVLNLFDIVRCYEKRDSGGRGIGKTTMAEAQLIGRGARYFPFVLPDKDDRYRRKFDSDLENELRVLEQLHYHSINDSHYISELRSALVREGVMDSTVVDRQTRLKLPFKETEIYKIGVLWGNVRQKKSYANIASFKDLGVSGKNYVHQIATMKGAQQIAFGDETHRQGPKEQVDVNVADLDRNIVQYAISQNPFFAFASLKRYFPNLHSMSRFISDDKYLRGLAITFEGSGACEWIDNRAEQLAAVSGLLRRIEAEVKAQVTEYEGSRRFQPEFIRDIFTDKTIKVDKLKLADEEGLKEFLSSKKWYVFDTLYGTSEEKAFVKMLDRCVQQLQDEGYGEFYLIRNERHFKLHGFKDGQGFEPDFLLLLLKKNGATSVQHMFIEPKGKHLQEHDRWKADFLKEITEQYGGKELVSHDFRYRLIGAPFYNNQDENRFRERLMELITEGEEGKAK